MAISNLTALPYIALKSEASAENFNRNLRQLADNLASTAEGASFSASSNLSLGGFIHAPIGVAIGAYPPSDATTAGLHINVNSNQSQYILLSDDAAQRSSYAIGSDFGL